MISRFLPKKRTNMYVHFRYLNKLWELRNFTANIFSQKFREINFLLKNFTLNWFDEKNFHGNEFLVDTKASK